MVEIPGKVVIRTYAPARFWLTLGGALVVIGAAAYLCFEYGRYRAGFDRVATADTEAQLREQVRILEAERRELRVQVASQETARVGQTRERAEVSRTIGELQAQLAKQSQDLAFYRGIVGKNAEEPAVKIQQFRLYPQPQARRFLMRIVLGRPVTLEDLVSGTIAVTIEGSAGENAAAFDLAKLTPDRKRELRFKYTFTQTLEQEIALPEEFHPLRTTIEIRASRGLTPVRETFLWTAEIA